MRLVSTILVIAFICLPTFSQEQQASRRAPSLSLASSGGPSNRTYLLHANADMQIPLCSKDVEYAEFYAIWKKADKGELQDAHDDGLFFTVLPNTEVIVIDSGSVTAGKVELNLVKVRVLRGTHRGEEAWTEERFLSDALVAENNPIKSREGKLSGHTGISANE